MLLDFYQVKYNNDCNSINGTNYVHIKNDTEGGAIRLYTPDKQRWVEMDVAAMIGNDPYLRIYLGGTQEGELSSAIIKGIGNGNTNLDLMNQQISTLINSSTVTYTNLVSSTIAEFYAANVVRYGKLVFYSVSYNPLKTSLGGDAWVSVGRFSVNVVHDLFSVCYNGSNAQTKGYCVFNFSSNEIQIYPPLYSTGQMIIFKGAFLTN